MYIVLADSDNVIDMARFYTEYIEPLVGPRLIDLFYMEVVIVSLAASRH